MNQRRARAALSGIFEDHCRRNTMVKDSVTLKLDGIVSVADFRTAIDAFADLMLALTAEINADAAVDWLVEDLRGGSALITSRGLFGNPESRHTVELVVDKYRSLAQAAREGRIDRYSDPVREAIRTLTGVVNGKIPAVEMGTPDDPVVARIEHRLEDLEDIGPGRRQPRSHSRAAVKGQVVTLDEKHALYFTLQEAYTQRHVRCWPTKEHRAHLGRYWSQKTWVIVEGTYLRFGDKPTLHQITDIVELPEAKRGDWRKAVGAATRGPYSRDMSSADAVRKVRDGEA